MDILLSLLTTITITIHETYIEQRNDTYSQESSQSEQQSTKGLNSRSGPQGEIHQEDAKRVADSNPKPATNRTYTSTYNKSCPYEDIIYKYFGRDSGKIAVAIALAESGCNPTSVNWEDAKITGMPSSGIFQINAPHNWAWDDPETNIKRAYEMYTRRGFQPWSVYNNKKYLAYLK